MNPISRRSFFAVALLLAGCGKPLGTYQTRNVTVVPGNALQIVDPIGCPDCSPAPQLLRVQFASNTDAYEVTGGGALYVFTSLCPYDEKRVIYVAIPYPDDRPSYDQVTRQEYRPTKNPKTGEYAYTTYLALSRSATPERPGQSAQIGYDLRRHPQDLCMRIHHPEYAIIPSRSRSFTVPKQMIQRAIERGLKFTYDSPSRR